MALQNSTAGTRHAPQPHIITTAYWHPLQLLMPSINSSPKSQNILSYANPFALAPHFWRRRDLLWQLARREIVGRYQGSYLGLLWSIINPLIMLAIYTFVFSIVFNARWGVRPDESRVEFALTLFCGLIAFNTFSECIQRAPTLIVQNANYVKKIVFPLEVLPVSVLISALFHAVVSLGVLLIGIVVAMRILPLTIIFLPFVMLPLICLSLGAAWFLASLGVFLRDINNTVGLLVQILFFMTPIFYRIDSIPEPFRSTMQWNPLAVIVEDFRRVVVWQTPPDWLALAGTTLLSLIVMLAGYAWFMRSKGAFADVL